MTTYQAPGPPRRVGPSAESTLLTLAILAVVVVLLSAVTLVPRGHSGGNVTTGGVGGLGSVPAARLDALGPGRGRPVGRA